MGGTARSREPDNSTGDSSDHGSADAVVFQTRALAALEQAMSALPEAHDRELSGTTRGTPGEMSALQTEFATARAAVEAARLTQAEAEADTTEARHRLVAAERCCY